MTKNFETQFTGLAFITSSILLWFGWVLSHHHIGEFIVPEDFDAIGERVWYWIWMFRIHIFGWVAMGVALMSLMSFIAKKPSRTLILPGIGVLIVGTFTIAIAFAFYYHFGALGVGKTEGMSAVEIEEFMNSVLVTNEYVICLVRFGRVFSGVGLVLLGAAFVKWSIVSKWLGWFTVILGLLPIIIIMGIPDNFEIYKPVFHIKVIWLLVMGGMLLWKGVDLSKAGA